MGGSINDERTVDEWIDVEWLWVIGWMNKLKRNIDELMLVETQRWVRIDNEMNEFIFNGWMGVWIYI